MPIRLGILSTAHVHAPSYARCAQALPNAEFVGIWDENPDRGLGFTANFGGTFESTAQALLEKVDAVAICSENTRHRALAELAFAHGVHVLCEKPLATTLADADAIISAASNAGKTLMTAFPCPFSPSFKAAASRIQSGDIGDLVAICSTNRGTCPFDWFVDPALSGGGAMIDHVVHVADLLRRILGAEPSSVFARTSNNLYSGDFEDSALIHLEYPNQVFATLDSSWSRPMSYKTWGDVTMNIVGTKGVIELDLFGQSVDRFQNGLKTHSLSGYASNLDRLMLAEFVNAIEQGRAPIVTGEDGRAALKVALDAYASLAVAA